MSSAFLSLLVFLPTILIPACASCSPAFLMMYSAYELNKQGDPCLGWVKSSANNRITQELAGAWKVTHRAQPVENILRGEIFSGFSPSGWAPIPPASHHRSATQLRNRSGALFHQPGSRHQHREGRENHRAMGKFPSISRTGSGHSKAIKAQIKGIRAQTSGPTSPTKLQTPGGRLTRFL